MDLLKKEKNQESLKFLLFKIDFNEFYETKRKQTKIDQNSFSLEPTFFQNHDSV